MLFWFWNHPWPSTHPDTTCGFDEKNAEQVPAWNQQFAIGTSVFPCFSLLCPSGDNVILYHLSAAEELRALSQKMEAWSFSLAHASFWQDGLLWKHDSIFTKSWLVPSCYKHKKYPRQVKFFLTNPKGWLSWVQHLVEQKYSSKCWLTINTWLIFWILNSKSWLAKTWRSSPFWQILVDQDLV